MTKTEQMRLTARDATAVTTASGQEIGEIDINIPDPGSDSKRFRISASTVANAPPRAGGIKRGGRRRAEFGDS